MKSISLLKNLRRGPESFNHTSVLTMLFLLKEMSIEYLGNRDLHDLYAGITRKMIFDRLVRRVRSALAEAKRMNQLNKCVLQIIRAESDTLKKIWDFLLSKGLIQELEGERGVKGTYFMITKEGYDFITNLDECEHEALTQVPSAIMKEVNFQVYNDYILDSPRLWGKPDSKAE